MCLDCFSRLLNATSIKMCAQRKIAKHHLKENAFDNHEASRIGFLGAEDRHRYVFAAVEDSQGGNN